MPKTILPRLASLPAAEIPAAVDAYAEAASYRKYSPTASTRRVIAALRAVGVERSDFQVRNPEDGGNGYMGAVATLRPRSAHERVIENAELIAACGLAVTIVELPSGSLYAIVSASRLDPGVYHQPYDRSTES